MKAYTYTYQQWKPVTLMVQILYTVTKETEECLLSREPTIIENVQPTIRRY